MGVRFRFMREAYWETSGGGVRTDQILHSWTAARAAPTKTNCRLCIAIQLVAITRVLRRTRHPSEKNAHCPFKAAEMIIELYATTFF